MPARRGDASSPPSARSACVVGEPLVAAPVLRQRHVGEVDDVDVEVDQQPVAALRHQRARALRGALGVGRDVVDPDRRDPVARDRLALVRGGLLRPPPEQQDVLRRQQRRALPRARELRHRARVAEHVRHPHPVQRALGDDRGHVEVRVRVEVDEPDALAGARRGRRPSRSRPCSRRRARARSRPSSRGSAHARRGLAHDLDDRPRRSARSGARGRAASARPRGRRGRGRRPPPSRSASSSPAARSAAGACS